MTKNEEKDPYVLLSEFEQANPDVVAEYRKFTNYSPQILTQVYKEWDAYYEACAKSLAAENFWEMKEAFKRNDLVEVRERVAWARELRMTGDLIQKPMSVDPYAYGQKQLILTYRQLLNAVRGAKKVEKIFS